MRLETEDWLEMEEGLEIEDVLEMEEGLKTEDWLEMQEGLEMEEDHDMEEGLERKQRKKEEMQKQWDDIQPKPFIYKAIESRLQQEFVCLCIPR